MKALIADKDRWTTKCTARDKRGRSMFPEHITAVQWCLAGAVINICPRGNRETIFTLLQRACVSHGFISVGIANDQGGFEAIHLVLDTAIKEADAEEKANVERQS